MEFHIGREPGHLVVQISGIPSEAEVRSMLHDMLNNSGQDVRGSLIEARVVSSLGAVGTKDLVTALPKMGFPADYRIAILLLEDSPRRNAKFAEDVAVNRGIGVRAFESREQALAWLLG